MNSWKEKFREVSEDSKSASRFGLEIAGHTLTEAQKIGAGVAAAFVAGGLAFAYWPKKLWPKKR